MNSEFTPKLFSLVREGISPDRLKKDIIAGIIVGIVALPLSIAFAIASGISPDKGILTAIIGGFIISLLGGSRVQIGGPTGAFVVIIAGIIATHGYDGLLIATLMAGILMVIMGAFSLGSLLKYIPHTLITGFTTAIAVIIFSTQIKDFTGMATGAVPGDFIGKWAVYVENAGSIRFWPIFLGVLAICIIVFLPRISRRIPPAFAAIVITTLIAWIGKLPVETIASRYGSLHFSIPSPGISIPRLSEITQLIVPAISIAILGSLESLLSAVVADSMIGGKHRSNMELIAQGTANILLPLLGGFPATGAIARTATNIKNGGRTPIAGIVHSVTLFFIYLAAMPIVSRIPMATLAGILIITAWNMAEVKTFVNSCKINVHETLILLVTFFLTLFTDLTIAIPTGFLLATVLFMKRMSDSIEITPLAATKTKDGSIFREELGDYSPQIIIFEIYGPMFFGSVHHLLNLDKEITQKHKAVILRFRFVPIVDTAGLARLKTFVGETRNKDICVYLSGVNEKVRQKLVKTGIMKNEAMFDDIKDAIAAAEECTARKTK